MRFLILIIGLSGLVAVVVVGALWTIVMMMPMGVLIGILIFVVFRADRKIAAERHELERQATRERLLNEQEYSAWRKETDDARRKNERRMRALRKFDNSRNPPTS